MITGWKKLSKYDRNHLKEQNIHTNEEWGKVRKYQEKRSNKRPVCLDCNRIAAILKS